METYAKGRVYKRGRIWFLDYALDAKRIRESAETTNKAVAERLLASKLAAIDEGSYTHIKKSKQITLFEWVERYLATYSNGRPTWLKNKQSLLQKIKEFFGGIRAD